MNSAVSGFSSCDADTPAWTQQGGSPHVSSEKGARNTRTRSTIHMLLIRQQRKCTFVHLAFGHRRQPTMFGATDAAVFRAQGCCFGNKRALAKSCHGVVWYGVVVSRTFSNSALVASSTFSMSNDFLSESYPTCLTCLQEQRNSRHSQRVCCTMTHACDRGQGG